MSRLFALFGALLAFLSVGLGAFGAHALGPLLERSGRTQTWQTATHYLMYHALALLVLGLYQMKKPTDRLVNSVGWLFISGIFLFSGSLFVLCLTGITVFGAITPFGGVSFLLGWALLARWVWVQR